MLGTSLGADNGSCPFQYKKENECKNVNPHILHFRILIFEKLLGTSGVP